MSFSDQFFDNHRGDLLEKLEQTGFSADQAKNFLGETASSLTASTQGISIADMLSGLMGDPVQQLRSINMDDIAQRLAVSPDQVQTGIDAIAPIFSQKFSQKSKGLVGSIGTLAGGSVGGIFDSARKFFS